MGSKNSKLEFANKGTTVYMLCGLQGAGKTTLSGKLALYLKNQKKKVLLVAADVYRPAAIDQLKVVGGKVDVEVFEMGKADPVKIETYPIDSLIAAAVNQKHHLTTIEAAGHSRTRSVIVERVNINGEWYHRTKTTSYLYFHTRRDAVQNARTRGIRIVEYG